MITNEMISVLACPRCKAPEPSIAAAEQQAERILAGSLRCYVCDTQYEIRDGIPDLVPRQLLSSKEWRLWRDHLLGLEARRKSRQQRPNSFATKATNQTTRLQKAFAEFTGIRSGAVLDVGCGPGNFRRQFDPRHVTYFGIDPLPLHGTSEFFFAEALAEFIPFQDGTFSDVVVMSALDHFRDLDAFFAEVVRVLRPDGKLHIVQSIHEVAGPLSALKMLAHWVKDLVEDSATRSVNSAAPKHMAEFTKSAVYQTVSRRFEVVGEKVYSKRWYGPTKLFLSLRVLPQPAPDLAPVEALKL